MIVSIQEMMTAMMVSAFVYLFTLSQVLSH